MKSQYLLKQLWCEPLNELGVGWLSQDDQPWVDCARRSPQASQLAYRLACTKLGLPSEPIPTPSDPHSLSLLEALPTTGPEMKAAALFTAMSAFAAEDAFAAIWLVHSKALMRVARTPVWRAAIAANNTRRLALTPGSLMAARCSDEFIAHGMSLLASACNALLPGLWLRLRLRCPRHLVQPLEAPGIAADFIPVELHTDAAACRQIMRLCASAPAAD